MIEYKVQENGIFYVKFIGKTSFVDVKNYLEKFKHIDALPLDIKLLYDFQDGEIDLIEDDLINIAKLADVATEKYNSVRTAFLTARPDTTAFSFLFSQLRHSPKNQRNVFSTYEAAMNWLKV